MKLKIRKGASVKVLTGSDKGKQGTVLDVDAKAMRVKIEGVKILTKHSKEHGIVKAAAAKKKTAGKKASKSKSA